MTDQHVTLSVDTLLCCFLQSTWQTSACLLSGAGLNVLIQQILSETNFS